MWGIFSFCKVLKVYLNCMWYVCVSGLVRKVFGSEFGLNMVLCLCGDMWVCIVVVKMFLISYLCIK